MMLTGIAAAQARGQADDVGGVLLEVFGFQGPEVSMLMAVAEVGPW